MGPKSGVRSGAALVTWGKIKGKCEIAKLGGEGKTGKKGWWGPDFR